MVIAREYPERPIVGVGAVIFLDQSVLLVRRGQAPGKGEWSLPGGAVELGEGLEEALRREMMEELSVRVEIGGLLGVFDRIFRDRGGEIRYHYVLVDYWGWIRSGRPKAGSDITEVRRFPLKELGALPLKEGLKETIGRAVEMRDRQRGLSDDL